MDFLARSSASFIELAAVRPHSTRPTSQDIERKRPRIDVWAPDPFSLSNKVVDEDKRQPSKAVKTFYKKQNAKIESLLKSVDQHRASADDAEAASKLAHRVAIYGSLAGNVVLAALQLYAAATSGSLSLFATMIDSIFDPFSNLIMLYCHRAAKKQNVYKWPSGKARMTTVGNISFCFIMMAASIVLIVESIRDVVEHIADKTAANTEPFHLSSLIVVSCAFATKLALMLYCWQHKARNTQIQILWEDHRNDLFINGLGIVTSVLGSKVVWWLDPAGAMFLSLCIIASWGNTAFGEFKLLVGISAGPDFLQLVTYTCVTHHPDIIQVDTCRAYHAGEGIIIEADVIMHESKTLRETHDISEDLQNKLERLPGVERAYVHTDFEASHLPEHRKNV